MSPLTAYKDLFGGFAPGATITDREALRLLKLRKSVLDYSLRELDRLKTLGPASERDKIDGHAAAVRKLEAQLSEQIAGGGATACALPPMPDAALTGKDGESLRGDYDELDGQHVRRDDTRGGGQGARRDPSGRVRLRPDPRGHLPVVARHQPRRVQGASIRTRPTRSGCTTRCPTGSPTRRFSTARVPPRTRYIWDAMVNVNRWYFQKTADIINELRLQVDPQDPAGGSLLDNTVIPMITEVAEASHTREGHARDRLRRREAGHAGRPVPGASPASTTSSGRRWRRPSSARMRSSKLASEVYVKNGASPISGLWVAPT